MKSKLNFPVMFEGWCALIPHASPFRLCECHHACSSFASCHLHTIHNAILIVNRDYIYSRGILDTWSRVLESYRQNIQSINVKLHLIGNINYKIEIVEVFANLLPENCAADGLHLSGRYVLTFPSAIHRNVTFSSDQSLKEGNNGRD